MTGDTVLDNALSYRLLNANNEAVAADTARNTPGTYTVVPAATLKSGWDERYSLNRVNGTLTVEDKVEELFTVTVTSGGNGTAYRKRKALLYYQHRTFRRSERRKPRNGFCGHFF